MGNYKRQNARIVRPLSNGPDPWDQRMGQIPEMTPQMAALHGFQYEALVPTAEDVQLVRSSQGGEGALDISKDDADAFGGRPLVKEVTRLPGAG